MIRYQRISGVTLEGSSDLPTIQRTPEGISMGAVPGWSVLLDPDYPVGNGLRNRAQKNKVATMSIGTLNLGEFDGGQSAVFADGYAQTLGPGVNRDGIDPDRFTIFTVIGDITSGPTNRQYITLPLQDNEGELTPTVAIIRLTDPARYQLAFYEDAINEIGRPTRAITSQSYSLDENSANLVMWTFSVEEGVGIWLNGEKVASNREDVRPLTAGYLSDEFRMFFAVRGKYGMSGILSIDLSAPENTGHRRAIEKFLMAKYGIPQGAP